jgi:Tfp pilus assembly protein PilZ
MQLHGQNEPRFKKRVPCELIVEGSRHPGIVLNLSRSGLFVQTAVTARRGDVVAVDLNASSQTSAIALDATVMWNRTVAAQLRGVRHGGVGLQIRAANESYYDLLAQVSESDGSLWRPAAVDRSAPEETPVFGFRIRVKQSGVPRSRTLFLSCANEAEARDRASTVAGRGWEIIEISRDQS